MDTKINSTLFHCSFVANIDTVSTEFLEEGGHMISAGMEGSLTFQMGGCGII